LPLTDGPDGELGGYLFSVVLPLGSIGLVTMVGGFLDMKGIVNLEDFGDG